MTSLKNSPWKHIKSGNICVTRNKTKGLHRLNIAKYYGSVNTMQILRFTLISSHSIWNIFWNLKQVHFLHFFFLHNNHCFPNSSSKNENQISKNPPLVSICDPFSDKRPFCAFCQVLHGKPGTIIWNMGVIFHMALMLNDVTMVSDLLVKIGDCSSILCSFSI